MKRVVWQEDERVGRWVCDRTGGSWSPTDSRAIGMESGGRLVAGVLFDHFNGRSIAMHVAGEGGHWMTRDFLRCTFGYAFLQLGVRKVLGLTDSSNAASRRLQEHLGFTLEARIADAAPRGDLLIYTMTPAQCRYIGG